MRARPAVLLAPAITFAVAGAALAEEPTLQPEATGVVLVSTADGRQNDPLLRQLAERLALRGLECVVGSDLTRPAIDVDERFARGHRSIRTARQARDGRLQEEAAREYDRAIAILEENTTNDQSLRVLVDALVERGAVATHLDDRATAEAAFLQALALVPNYVLSGSYVSDESRALFETLKAIMGRRPGGRLTIGLGGLKDAIVRIDFGAPLAPPFSQLVPGGAHFVSVSSPDRTEVVVRVMVRANDEERVFVRPPVLGDLLERTRTLASFRADEATSRAAVVEASGLRFLLVADFSENGVALDLFERTGHAVLGGSAVLPLEPDARAFDEAVTKLLAAAKTVEPSLGSEEQGAAWYSSWWGITLISIGVAGAAATSALLLSAPRETEYVFVP